MPTLYLVRHGQASFGAADYDELSALGARQCAALGQWFAARGVRFDAVLRGTLKRHTQSLAAMDEGYGGTLPPAEPWPGLDEYDSHAIVAAVRTEPLPPADSTAAYRAHFRALRDGLQAWMAGRTAPAGMPSHAGFVAGVVAALDHVRTHAGDDVLAVTSGGPIATAVAHVLGVGPDATIELNLRIRNSAVTEMVFTPKGHRLLAFNHLPHLDAAERRAWETYS